MNMAIDEEASSLSYTIIFHVKRKIGFKWMVIQYVSQCCLFLMVLILVVYKSEIMNTKFLQYAIHSRHFMAVNINNYYPTTWSKVCMGGLRLFFLHIHDSRQHSPLSSNLAFSLISLARKDCSCFCSRRDQSCIIRRHSKQFKFSNS